MSNRKEYAPGRSRAMWANRRVGRRPLLRGIGAGAFGITAAALIGCGDEDEQATATAAPGGTGAASTAVPSATAALAAPVRGGTVRMSSISALGGMDPHNSFGGGGTVIPRVYNYLFRMSLLDPGIGIRYDLAESHEVAGDGTTWTFKLRPDVKVQPNSSFNTSTIPERALTASDVVANFDRVADPGTGATGFQFVNSEIARWEAPDDTTFVLQTKQPYAWFDAGIGSHLNLPLAPREFLENADVVTEAVGGGPFMMKRASERQGWTMARNPSYRDSSLPYVDEIDYAQFADQVTVRTSFEGGELDFYSPTTIKEMEVLQQQYPKYQAYRQLTPASNYIYMNMKFDLWKDDRARLAMNRGLNRQEFVDIAAFGDGTVMGVLTPAFVDYVLSDEEIAQLQPYDPAESAKLFAAAGVKEFSCVQPTYAPVTDFANILQKQMQDVGVKAVMDPMDTSSWLAVFYDSSYESTTIGTSASYPDPDTLLKAYRTGGPFGNDVYSTSFSNQEIDDAIAAAALVLDVDERIAAYKDLQRLIIKGGGAKERANIRFYSPKAYVMAHERIQNYSNAVQMANALDKELWIDAKA